ncbi:MAG: hypothetical protein ACOCYE_12825, partial [Pseudomonadota bacterium]
GRRRCGIDPGRVAVPKRRLRPRVDGDRMVVAGLAFIDRRGETIQWFRDTDHPLDRMGSAGYRSLVTAKEKERATMLRRVSDVEYATDLRRL